MPRWGFTGNAPPGIARRYRFNANRLPASWSGIAVVDQSAISAGWSARGLSRW